MFLHPTQRRKFAFHLCPPICTGCFLVIWLVVSVTRSPVSLSFTIWWETGSPTHRFVPSLRGGSEPVSLQPVHLNSVWHPVVRLCGRTRVIPQHRPRGCCYLSRCDVFIQLRCRGRVCQKRCCACYCKVINIVHGCDVIDHAWCDWRCPPDLECLRFICSLHSSRESENGKRLYLFSVYMSQTQWIGWMLLILTHLLFLQWVHGDTMARLYAAPFSVHMHSAASSATCWLNSACDIFVSESFEGLGFSNAAA